jgi:hypothetical protein
MNKQQQLNLRACCIICGRSKSRQGYQKPGDMIHRPSCPAILVSVDSDMATSPSGSVDGHIG